MRPDLHGGVPARAPCAGRIRPRLELDNMKLRQTDNLSNDERDIFLFASFDGFLKPIYLPLYQTAGCITAAVHAFCETAQEFNSQADPQQKMLTMERMVGQVDVTTSEALSEVFELVSFVLKRLWGPTHRKDMDVVGSSRPSVQPTRGLHSSGCRQRKPS